MGFVRFFIDLFGWLTIAGGTAPDGALLGFLLARVLPASWGLWPTWVASGLAFIAGAVWATRIWKKHDGTADWPGGIRRIS